MTVWIDGCGCILNLFIYLFIYSFIYLSIYLFIYLFIFRQNSENTYMDYAWWMQQHETLSSIRITSFDSIPIWLLNKKYFEWYYFLYQALSQFTVQKISFPLRISSVNVTKSSGNCGFGHILLKKSFMENFIFCAMIGKGNYFFIKKNVLKGLLLDGYIQIQKDSMNTMTVNLELMLLWIYIKRKPSKFHIIIYGANIINEVLLSGNALHWLYQKKLAMACFLFHRNIEIDLPKMLQDQFPLGCQLTV